MVRGFLFSAITLGCFVTAALAADKPREAQAKDNAQGKDKETQAKEELVKRLKDLTQTAAGAAADKQVEDARKQVDSITQEVSAGNWDGVKTSAGTLGQACQSCHGAYRDRMDDGTYRSSPTPKNASPRRKRPPLRRRRSWRKPRKQSPKPSGSSPRPSAARRSAPPLAPSPA